MAVFISPQLTSSSTTAGKPASAADIDALCRAAAAATKAAGGGDKPIPPPRDYDNDVIKKADQVRWGKERDGRTAEATATALLQHTKH